MGAIALVQEWLLLNQTLLEGSRNRSFPDYVFSSFSSIAIMERGRTGLTPKPTARLGSSSFELLVAVGGDIPSTFRGTLGTSINILSHR